MKLKRSRQVSVSTGNTDEHYEVESALMWKPTLPSSNGVLGLTDIEILEESALAQAQATIQRALNESGLKRSAVAEKMSRPRSFVTRMLSGSHNLTVKTFARALAACGYELKLSYGPIQWGWAPHQMNLCAEDIDSAAPASCGQFEAYAPSVGFEVSALLA